MSDSTRRYQARTSEEVARRLKADRRGELRHTIPLPVRVIGGNEREGQWSELVETLNISAGGVALKLSRKVLIGDILFLHISLPERFQTDSEPSPTKSVYARVRCVELHGLQQIVRLQYMQRLTRRRTLVVSAKY